MTFVSSAAQCQMRFLSFEVLSDGSQKLNEERYSPCLLTECGSITKPQSITYSTQEVQACESGAGEGSVRGYLQQLRQSREFSDRVATPWDVVLSPMFLS